MTDGSSFGSYKRQWCSERLGLRANRQKSGYIYKRNYYKYYSLTDVLNVDTW